MRTPHIVVIGAGIGGLSAALLLAAQGVAVTVLERAAAPGGKMRTVGVAGRALDAGPTVFTMRWVFEEIFAAAGTSLDAQLDLRPAATLARHAWSATERLDLFADIERSADAIGAFAGAAEARGYRDFCARSRHIYRTLEQPFIRGALPTPLSLVRGAGLRGLGGLWQISPFETLWKALGENFRDPRLRQLFGRYATYCGSSPFLAPATLMLVAHVEQDGVWLVQGGMHRLATSLAATGARHGAVFRYGAEVAEINVDGGRASGVRLAGGEQIAADAVVSNTDVAALAAVLFGTAAAEAVPRVDPAGRSLSAITWAMVARADGFPLLRHTVFFSRDYAAEFADLFRRARLPGEPTVYICAQDRDDAGTGAAGEERLLCLVNAPANGDRRELPAKELEQCTNRMLVLLERCGLKLHHRPEATVTTTPAQFERLFPATGGALYGQAVHGAMASFRRPGSRSRLPGLYLAGGSTHPGAGGADGGTVRTAGGGQPAGGPVFDVAVPHGGYVWWYVDALSDDGRHGITLIAFLGSVFSPYYAWARRFGAGDPLQHCALNVALYGDTRAWAMTERDSAAVQRSVDELVIGPSALHWDGDSLRIDIAERTLPFGRRLCGTVRVRPEAVTGQSYALDAERQHEWSPLAPRAHVEVSLEHPALRWSGPGYLDSNRGDVPLEQSFSHWSWSRAAIGDGSLVLYDVAQHATPGAMLALQIDRQGGVTSFDPPPRHKLPHTRWRVARDTRAMEGDARVVRTLEDTPFYARSVIESRLLGHNLTAMHETLSLRRFRQPVVQGMLAFRMPRALGKRAPSFRIAHNKV